MGFIRASMTGGTQQERERLRSLLKELRKETGLRQVDLAQRLGKPQSYVSKYESGEKTLDVLEAREVCEALGIRLSDFVKELERKQ
jgi:transcriptional regulator with XRE-family HTH domain